MGERAVRFRHAVHVFALLDRATAEIGCVHQLVGELLLHRLAVAAVAGEADLVLCMSINPGYSGQAFMPDALDRVGRLRAALPESVHVQVDGGVDLENLRSIRDAGATLLVAGSAIFRHDDPAGAYRRLVQALA